MKKLSAILLSGLTALTSIGCNNLRHKSLLDYLNPPEKKREIKNKKIYDIHEEILRKRQEEVNETSEYENRILEYISNQNVEIIGDFNTPELEDIAYVLKRYKEELGDISHYNFKIGNMRFNKGKHDKDLAAQGYPETFQGYFHRGMCDLKGDKVRVASKEGIEDVYEWQKTGKNPKHNIPKGQEGLERNFRWVVAHELAHALSFKEEFGYDMLPMTHESYSHKSGEFDQRWEMFDSSLETEYGSAFEDSSVRPIGYPSFYGSSGDHECFADSVAYIITNSDYANTDLKFLERIKLITDKFQEIKSRANQE